MAFCLAGPSDPSSMAFSWSVSRMLLLCSNEPWGLAGFEMLQAGVQNFFDPAKFCPPEIAHIVKALVDRIEAGVNSVELRVHFGA